MPLPEDRALVHSFHRDSILDIIQRMLPADHACALHLLQQMGPATGSLAHIPYQLSLCSTSEAVILTAQILTEAPAVVAAAAKPISGGIHFAAGIEAHATAIAACAAEEEAAQVAQAAT